MQDQPGAGRGRIVLIALLAVAGVLQGAPAAHASPQHAAAPSARLLAEASWHGRPIRHPLPARAAASVRAERTPTLHRGSGYAAGGSTRVRDLQRRLLRLGYRPGPSDGLFGPRTQAALLAFQHKHGLEQTGAADGQTLRVLRERTAARQAREPAVRTTTTAVSPQAERRAPANAPTPTQSGPHHGGLDRASVAATAAALLLATLIGVALLARRRGPRRPPTALPRVVHRVAPQAQRPPAPWPAPRETPLTRVIGYINGSRPGEGERRIAPPQPPLGDGVPAAWELEFLDASSRERATRPPAAPRRQDEQPIAAARPARRPSEEERAALRARILWMREEGMTLQAIADQLNIEGQKTLSGRDFWRPANVRAAAAPPRDRTGRQPARHEPSRRDGDAS